MTLRGLSACGAQSMFDPGARQGLARAIGKHGGVGVSIDSGEPPPQLRCGAPPERDDTLLASLAVQKQRGRPVEEHVGDVQTGDLGDAGAGVVEHGEEDGVALPAPSGPVGRVDDRGDLVAGQVAEDGPVEALDGNREDALRDGQQGRLAQRGVAHEGPDGGEPEVAGARGIAASGLEMVEEAEDPGRVEIQEGQRRGGASGALRGVPEEQREGVAVAGDRVPAGAPLCDEAPVEELLQECGECPLDGGHDGRSDTRWAKRSKRCPVVASNSGTAVQYQ